MYAIVSLNYVLLALNNMIILVADLKISSSLFEILNLYITRLMAYNIMIGLIDAVAYYAVIRRGSKYKVD